MAKQSSAGLSYTEEFDKLKIRITAHKRFSNLSLEDWLGENSNLKPGDAVLDIGCGSGNLFPTYNTQIGDRGLIVGFDKSAELLAQANAVDVSCHKILLKIDMDEAWPIISGGFHLAISTFAIYYADSISKIIRELEDLLLPTGRVCFIGPTRNNASELYAYTKSIFGSDRTDKGAVRTHRLEDEILPHCKKVFREVDSQFIESKLVFPDKDEFVKYYCASLLFDEARKDAGRDPLWEELVEKAPESPELSKEMIAVWGYK